MATDDYAVVVNSTNATGAGQFGVGNKSVSGFRIFVPTTGLLTADFDFIVFGRQDT